MTYDLRRLRLHGFIERIPKTHRYRVTKPGLRAALFFTRTYCRIFRPGLALVMSRAPPMQSKLQTAFDNLSTAVHQWCDQAKLAA